MTCPKCGEVLPDNATTCSFCGEAITPAPVTETQPTQDPTYTPPVEEKPENVVGGTVGALIGALLGGASIVLLFQMNIMAALGGLLLAFCALKGYELLGGKLSTKGIIISVILMLITPAVAYFLAEAISLIGEYAAEGIKVPLGEAVSLVIDWTKNIPEVQSIVVKNLLMLYGFTVLGGFSLVLNAFKKKK